MDRSTRQKRSPACAGRPIRLNLNGLLIYLALSILALFFLLPLLWMVLSSFKMGPDIATEPLIFRLRDMSFDSYVGMLQNVPLWIGFKNTLIVIFFKGAINLFFCPLAGFAFAKMRFRGREALFNFMLATLMLPPIVMLIPLLLEMGALGWVDSYQALIFPGAIAGFYIFLMRAQISDVPDELLDAGRVDGAGTFQLYWRIVMPMMRPAMAALAILVFLDIYNDFVWPVIAINSLEMQTLQIMLSYLQTQINNASVGTAGANAWGQILAASTLATLPLFVLFITMQKQFVQGIMAGALKG